MKTSSHCTETETLLVTPLNCLLRTDLERAGGKAANLGELVQAGFPVPPGFAVTTAAYERFLAHSGLTETITRTLAEQQPAASGGAAIRAAFEAAPIPPEVEQAILAAYRQLGPGPVAVRSSATAEDLPGASFAGQQDTFLNVVGAQALLDAVRRCWASLWNDRAMAYRDSQGIDPLTVRLAVVVQRMVAAEVAGVMFTANPVTGARGEIVVDANPGLGEAVVSGLVTPDHFILRRRGWLWQVAERRAGRRELIIQARSGGGTEQVTGSTAAAGETVLPALSDAALRRLARLGAAIQRHFGSPQDVEWAWAGGRPFVLQARPITALAEPAPHINFLQRMVASNFAEMLPLRPYPLDLDTWAPALGSAVEPMFQLLGVDWRLKRMLEEEDGVILRYLPVLPRLTWQVLLIPVRLVSLSLRYNPIHWQSDPLLAETLARARALQALDLSSLSWEQLLGVVQAAKDIPLFAAGEIRRRYFPGAALATLRLRLLLALLGHAGQLGALLSGVENKTLELNHALEELAQKIRSDPNLAQIFSTYPPEELWTALEQQPEGRAFIAGLRAFLERYGHRETVISTALQPTWKDAPAQVLGMLKNFAAVQPQLPTGKPAWQAARDELLRHPLLQAAPLRSAFLETLAAARALLQIREDTHFYATLSMPVFRRVFLEFGARLVDAGVLTAPEDGFHLRLAELERLGRSLPPPADLAAHLRAAVARRKEKRARLEGTPPFDPRIFLQNHLEEEDVLLRGMSGSPGVAEGPARILRDGSEFDKLLAGDVLVAPYTNPSWTPLFQRAVAVVVDSGSPISHAAIVAREYGIPAVMGTVTGSHTLQDGDYIRVDGSRGVIYRVTPTGTARNRLAGSIRTEGEESK